MANNTDTQLLRDLEDFTAQGRNLIKRIAMRHAQTGQFRDHTCELLGRLGHLVAEDGALGQFQAQL